MVPDRAEVVLLAQHGWADTNRAMAAFGQAVATPTTLVVAPNLGYSRTWLRMAPLVDVAEQETETALVDHPTATLRVVGHSMGGLIWIELLTRRPDWRARTDRLVLIGCPVAGAELAAILDPLGLTIARDLCIDRREQAEALAASIPTLVIVGDLLGPHDGTVSHNSARVGGARFVQIASSSHAGLRRSRWVTALVRAFLSKPEPPFLDLGAIIARFQRIPGLQSTPSQLKHLASVAVMFEDGATIRTLKLSGHAEMVFIVNAVGLCLYAGLASGRNQRALHGALQAIRTAHTDALVDPSP